MQMVRPHGLVCTAGCGYPRELAVVLYHPQNRRLLGRHMPQRVILERSANTVVDGNELRRGDRP